MGLIAPREKGYVGGITRLQFDRPVTNLKVKVNGVAFHTSEGDNATKDQFTLNLNPFPPDSEINIEIIYDDNGVQTHAARTVYKPRHDLGGMGATVIRSANGEIEGVFFKLWLPNVRQVFVRGIFNDWVDANALDQLGDSGYWYGFSQDARPGNDYKFFVYDHYGKFSEVSDPAARQTIKTHYNASDANDANAVVVDFAAFKWHHDLDWTSERRDFRRMNIYQLHWGTFLREAPRGAEYEKFAAGDSEMAKRQYVRNKLQYVKDLGFTAVELLPVHEANGSTNAGYDPSFFFAVEHACGTPDDVRILVDEAHGMGLAIIFDAVINHLTKDETHSSFSQEFLRGWYTKKDAPWSNHMQWGGDDWGPDPDFDRAEIRNLLTDCLIMYAEEFHVDGIRFDATTTIPSHALKPMIERLRIDDRTRHLYLMAEHLTEDPLPYVVGQIGFHGGWYKPAFETTLHGALGQPGRGDLGSLKKAFETDYQGEPTTAIKYLSGSHDENWTSHHGTSMISRLGGSQNEYARMKQRLALALQAVAPGTPMTFMGTELLPDLGWHEYEGYGTYSWRPKDSSPAGQVKKLVQDINWLRNNYEALRNDNTHMTLVHQDETNGVLAYRKWDDNGAVFLIVINISDNNWAHREYRVHTGVPQSSWHETFNSQYVNYGGWTGSGNADDSFYPTADYSGVLQGINVPKWSMQILQQQN